MTFPFFAVYVGLFSFLFGFVRFAGFGRFTRLDDDLVPLDLRSDNACGWSGLWLVCGMHSAVPHQMSVMLCRE